MSDSSTPIPFAKYHALGNDYLVIDSASLATPMTAAAAVHICHRHFGIGSDGILLLEGKDTAGAFILTIYNPDGSTAEKSGNGLRIFSRYLFDQGLVGEKPFKVATQGGLVEAVVVGGGSEVVVEMGTVSFDSAKIPVAGAVREVLRERMEIAGESIEYSAATVGNPHCVVHVAEARADMAKRLGPAIEVEPRFPNRTNVQFLQVLDRNNIRIEIWERGAGYTLASGSSSSAAAAVAKRLGLCDGQITVHMPGGALSIQIAEDFQIRMRGAVTRVADGSLSPELFSWPIPA